MAYSPAFQLYYKDFRQDPKTICMNAAEIGSYFLLIMECWDRDNTLPNDLEELAVIARVTLKQFEKMWATKIRRCFQFDGTRDVFWHKRLQLEIDKQKRWAVQQSQYGKKGAEKRWSSNDTEINSLNGDPIASPCRPHSDPIGSDSFSFSSSSSFKDFKRLIETHARENFPNSDVRLVEIGMLYTLLQRNGSTEPIRSMKYFDPEIKKVLKDSKGMSSKTIDALLKRRREQLWPEADQTNLDSPNSNRGGD